MKEQICDCWASCDNVDCEHRGPHEMMVSKFSIPSQPECSNPCPQATCVPYEGKIKQEWEENEGV
jgi:hypothetical protein